MWFVVSWKIAKHISSFSPISRHLASCGGVVKGVDSPNSQNRSTRAVPLTSQEQRLLLAGGEGFLIRCSNALKYLVTFIFTKTLISSHEFESRTGYM